MNLSNTHKARVMNMVSMLIFGTIGIFRRYIPVSSSLLALLRGFIGMLFLLMMIKISHNSLSYEPIKRNFKYLIFSGLCLGFNWILLFEAYQYTTVACATLCYYMAPILLIMISPVLFKEKLTLFKSGCVIMALVGMIFVSGILEVGLNIGELTGILYGLGAAFLYTGVMVFNKKINDINSYDKTIVQLGISTIALFFYTLVTEDISLIHFDLFSIIMIIFVGIVHTGIAYTLYFGSMKDLKAHTIALFSYIDPISAILLSSFILNESMSSNEFIGMGLIMIAAILSEIIDTK